MSHNVSLISVPRFQVKWQRTPLCPRQNSTHCSEVIFQSARPQPIFMISMSSKIYRENKHKLSLARCGHRTMLSSKLVKQLQQSKWLRYFALRSVRASSEPGCPNTNVGECG